jgi:hypothetical protein
MLTYTPFSALLSIYFLIFINFGPTSSKNLWQNFAIYLEYNIGFSVHRFAGERPVHAGGT